MKDVEYIRVDSRIYNSQGQLMKDHQFVNAAKRWSRQYQMGSGGRLGDGRIRVASKPPRLRSDGQKI